MIDPCEEVILSVTDEEGIEITLDYLFEKARGGNVPAAGELMINVYESNDHL